VLAVVRKRPGDVLRIALDRAVEPDLGPLLELARARSLEVERRAPEDLARLAQSANHEGVCIQVRARRWLAPVALADALGRDGSVALALDRVRNPYNVGAIVRTAAFFGLGGVVLGAPAPHPALAPDAARVAEGGAEELPLVRTTDLARTLAQLRERGVLVVGVESDGHDDLLAVARSLPRPLVLVVGHEREGLSTRVRAECQRTARIVGVSPTFSLNVSVATSIAIAAVAGGPRRG
jgi:TrmH RNA methyltransferase